MGTVPFPVVRVVRIGACEWSEHVFRKESEGKLESLLTHIFHIGINSFYRGIFRKPAAKRWAVSSRKSRTL